MRMDHKGLPGIDELFREQDRLAKKLSQEELNALRRYLQKAVHTQCESVVARMRYLQTAHDVNETQFQRALDKLQIDLTREQSIAGEFRREFGSLAKVVQAREVRHREQHDTLVKEVRQSKEALKDAIVARRQADRDLAERDKDLARHKDLLHELENQLAQHHDCHQLRETVSRLANDLLKTKVEKDKLRKDLEEARARLQRGGRTGPARAGARDGGITGGGGGESMTSKAKMEDRSPSIPLNSQKENLGTARRLGEEGNNSSGRSHVRFKSSPSSSPPAHADLAPTWLPKNSPATFTPVTPYCSAPNACRARLDLEECRGQLIHTCQELAWARAALSQKSSRRKKGAEPKKHGGRGVEGWSSQLDALIGIPGLAGGVGGWPGRGGNLSVATGQPLLSNSKQKLKLTQKSVFGGRESQDATTKPLLKKKTMIRDK